MSFNVTSDLLDACVLATLIKEPTYGYKMTQDIKNLVDVSESTLYPVLRRLQLSNFLDTYDEEYLGRNRRYYRITEKGRGQVDIYKTEWIRFTKMINTILITGGQHD